MNLQFSKQNNFLITKDLIFFLLIFWFSLVFCVIAAFCESSTSTNIECDYADSYYTALGDIYQCEVIINPIILTEESAEIRGINGTHERLKSNNDVIAFYAELETIQFFPKGLDFFLKNLKVIDIVSC